jgi:DNA end-binding protein Ku
MARSLWSGAITFGLIHVPVKLYGATPASSGHELAFHRLHDRCGTRLRNLRWCPHCDEEVGWDHVVSGYEFERGRFAIVKREELPEPERGERAAIGIEDFVDGAELDPLYFDRAYWIAPEGTPRTYALLHRALHETGHVAIARVLVRTRSHLAVVRTAGEHLQLVTLFFANEVTREAEIPAGAEGVTVGARELELAKELVTKMSAPWDPARYADTTTAKLRELIEKKIAEHETVETGPVELPAREVVDITEALRRSVERAATARAEQSPRRKRKV